MTLKYTDHVLLCSTTLDIVCLKMYIHSLSGSLPNSTPLNIITQCTVTTVVIDAMHAHNNIIKLLYTWNDERFSSLTTSLSNSLQKMDGGFKISKCHLGFT